MLEWCGSHYSKVLCLSILLCLNWGLSRRCFPLVHLRREIQCSQASSPSVFRQGRDGRQVGDLCPGRTPGWQSVLINARDGRPGPIGVLVYVSFLNLMSIRSVLWRSEDFFYSNIEKIKLYYHVSNFAINQPMLPVISDPGLYL